MDKVLPDIESFPYDTFLSAKEERERYIKEWAEGKRPKDVPVVIAQPYYLWDGKCKDREEFLRWNLLAMATSAEYVSDGVFAHLQPFYGVGVYASAFGGRYHWFDDKGPQTKPVFSDADDVADIMMPQPGDSEPMREVLDRIHWLRKVTNDRLPICLTDTQSPNNLGSQVIDVNEFFTVSSFEPERLDRFMKILADLIIAFSEMQMDAIGPNLILPGWQSTCHPDWQGIAVSDDNMAMISPRAYEVAALPYNSRIAEHFGGIALHSCGKMEHNIAVQLRTPFLKQMECSGCYLMKDSDPGPNPPELIREGYQGSDVIVNVRVNKGEIELLDRLLAPDFKCILLVTGVETKEESEKVYDQFKSAIRDITAEWNEPGPS